MSSQDINVSDLLQWIPHRPPMVWIDYVSEFSGSGGVCVLKLKKDEAYMDSRGLRSSSLIEFMAQAHAFISICENQKDPSRKVPKRAFLASIRDAVFMSEDELKAIPVGTILKIQTTGHRQVGPITLFTAKVQTEDNKVLCAAAFKVFAE